MDTAPDQSRLHSRTIRRVEAVAAAIPFRRPYRWANGVQRGINVTIVTIELDDGSIGHGEITLDVAEAAVAYVRHLASYFVGRRGIDIVVAIRDMLRQARWEYTYRFTRQVLSGIEVACWDAVGRSCGTPVYVFLGGQAVKNVEFFGFIHGLHAEEVAEDAKALVDNGYSTLYMKVGSDGGSNLRHVARVRDAVGPEVRLRLDANEAWDVPDAIEQIRKLEKYQIDWIEQPISLHNMSGLAEVRRAVRTKVAIDQGVFSAGELRQALEGRAADIVVLGQHEAGGLWSLRQMAYLAEVYGVPVNRHGSFETGISTLATLQVMSSIPNQVGGHQMMHQLLEYDLTLGSMPTPVGGRLEVPDRPGIGLELDKEAVATSVERHAVAGPYGPAHWEPEREWKHDT